MNTAPTLPRSAWDAVRVNNASAFIIADLISRHVDSAKGNGDPKHLVEDALRHSFSRDFTRCWYETLNDQGWTTSTYFLAAQSAYATRDLAHPHQGLKMPDPHLSNPSDWVQWLRALADLRPERVASLVKAGAVLTEQTIAAARAGAEASWLAAVGAFGWGFMADATARGPQAPRGPSSTVGASGQVEHMRVSLLSEAVDAALDPAAFRYAMQDRGVTRSDTVGLDWFDMFRQCGFRTPRAGTGFYGLVAEWDTVMGGAWWWAAGYTLDEARAMLERPDGGAVRAVATVRMQVALMM